MTEPKWLKPEEVREEGVYFVYEPKTSFGPASIRNQPSFVYSNYEGGRLFLYHAGGDVPIVALGDGYLFYGPLPEPPPPEEK